MFHLIELLTLQCFKASLITGKWAWPRQYHHKEVSLGLFTLVMTKHKIELIFVLKVGETLWLILLKKDDLEGSTINYGKQYKPHESRYPSRRVSLEI